MENNNSIEDSNENVDHRQVNNDDINIDIIEYKKKKNGINKKNT